MLFRSFIAFVVDIILTVIVEYFWDLHCLAVVYCFQLCLFYFSLLGTTILTVFLLVIALFVCIMCHYCLSGPTILTLINHGIFVLVIALFVCTVSYFSRSCWVHVFLLFVLYAFLFVY